MNTTIERGILYTADMVRARNAGLKTQTRRTTGLNKINKHPNDWMLLKLSTDPSSPLLQAVFEHTILIDNPLIINCRYGKPRDHLYVRETFFDCAPYNKAPLFADRGCRYLYRADGDNIGCHKWTPSLLMPRAASRGLDLIENIRLERLHDITGADCIAEGAAGGHGSIPGYNYATTPLEHYRHIWETINGASSWGVNPWVWVIEFKVIQPIGVMQ